MPRRATADPRFGSVLRALIDERGVSFRALAARTNYGKSYLHGLATGERAPTLAVARRLDEALGAGGALAAMVQAPPPEWADDELDALELSRRVAASDVGAETLVRLEGAVDDLASAYATTPPEELLPRVRRHLAYVGRLLDARKTLDEHQRLVTAGAWLSLLAATVNIDMRRRVGADANLETARQMAEHARHDEIRAWCLETQAWDVLTSGDYRRAVELSRHAQAIAPRGSSAHIQATAQEGRAWARMGRAAETHDALDRVARLASLLPTPERPEHHYRYDPGKALSYTATTLAWVGDPAAEDFARAVVTELEDAPNGDARPRRAASAKLDLSLALLAASKPDEASAVAISAIASGRIVASNWWRVEEVLSGVEQCGITEADDLREVCHAYRPAVRGPAAEDVR